MKDVRASKLAIAGNVFLFIIKLITGFLYNSISVISDAMNSLMDIIASIIVTITIKVSHKGPDEEHQFGHTRAQPIAGLIVAILTFLVGYEVIINAVSRLIRHEAVVQGVVPLVIMSIVFFIKLFLFIYTRNVLKKTKSVALKATLVDHRNDIIISISVFAALVLVNLGYQFLDPIMAIVVGLYIIWAGFEVAKENIDYLMGAAPPKEIYKKAKKIAESVKGVLGINRIRAHMLGTHVGVEVSIFVNSNLRITKAHDIGKEVKKKLEHMPEIHRAQIHIDPKYR